MKKRMSLLALLLAMTLLLAACGGQENKDAATEAPAAEEPAAATQEPTEPPKTEEELILERDAAAIKLSVGMVKTMTATAGEKAAAAEEGSKVARYYNRIAKTDCDNPFRAIVLAPTEEQFQAVKAMFHVEEEYTLAPVAVNFINTMLGYQEYAEAADNVAAEADASAVGENVIVLLPYQDVVLVTIHNGKAQSSLIISDNKDFGPEGLSRFTPMLGITDPDYRNYSGDEVKTMLGK